MIYNPLSSIVASFTTPIGLSWLCCKRTIGFSIYPAIALLKAVGSTTSFPLSLSFVLAYPSISIQFSISLTDFAFIWKKSESFLSLMLIINLLNVINLFFHKTSYIYTLAHFKRKHIHENKRNHLLLALLLLLHCVLVLLLNRGKFPTSSS